MLYSNTLAYLRLDLVQMLTETSETYAGLSSSKKRPFWLGHSELHAMLAEPPSEADVDSIKCVM